MDESRLVQCCGEGQTWAGRGGCKQAFNFFTPILQGRGRRVGDIRGEEPFRERATSIEVNK
jgi:hypothetical protein